MKLPDFSKNIYLLLLQQQMGLLEIPPLPQVEFKRPVTMNRSAQVPNIEGMRVRRRLIERGIDTLVADLLPDPKSFLLYKGQRVAAYIRDQKYDSDIEREISRYYHLCDCLTLRHIRVYEKRRKYIATRRSDGFFKVNSIMGDNVSTGLVKLDLCPHCREILTYNAVYRHPFLLTDYFGVDEGHIPEMIEQIQEVVVEEAYLPNLDDLFREYRKVAGDKCQLCGVDCSDASSHDLLNLHFRDGNPARTESANLAILCHDCYSVQPGRHARPAPVKADLVRIDALRRDQGIISAAVFDYVTSHRR
jgi:hypothetical protein